MSNPKIPKPTNSSLGQTDTPPVNNQKPEPKALIPQPALSKAKVYQRTKYNNKENTSTDPPTQAHSAQEVSNNQDSIAQILANVFSNNSEHFEKDISEKEPVEKELGKGLVSRYGPNKIVPGYMKPKKKTERNSDIQGTLQILN